MRSKSPIREMFNKKSVYKINDDNLPNGKFNNHLQKNKKFSQNNKFLDNDVDEEIPDENEMNQNVKPKKYLETASRVRSQIDTGIINKPINERGDKSRDPTPKKANINRNNNLPYNKANKSPKYQLFEYQSADNNQRSSKSPSVNLDPQVQYLKLCRANRGNCLIETLKNSLYKTMRNAWDSLSINLA